MLMKRWRVGSLSMGIILLAFGILLLVSLIVKINVINIICTLSPIVLICLGIEILLHLFAKSDGNEIKIKYDFLSVIFVSVILIISTGLYILMGITGFFETKEEMFIAFGIRNETVCKEYAQEFENADEITLFGNFNDIKILSTDSNKIKVEYYIKVNTSDKNYAESIIDKTVKIETENRQARMITNTGMLYYDYKLDYPVIICAIYMPKDKIADLSQCDYWRDISIDNRIEAANIIRP